MALSLHKACFSLWWKEKDWPEVLGLISGVLFVYFFSLDSKLIVLAIPLRSDFIFLYLSSLQSTFLRNTMWYPLCAVVAKDPDKNLGSCNVGHWISTEKVHKPKSFQSCWERDRVAGNWLARGKWRIEPKSPKCLAGFFDSSSLCCISHCAVNGEVSEQPPTQFPLGKHVVNPGAIITLWPKTYFWDYRCFSNRRKFRYGIICPNSFCCGFFPLLYFSAF